MTTEHSTYTYEGGEQETVTLRRGNADPHGHALLKIEHSSGRIADCYVDLAWLRDRADQLADTPRPLTPDAITDEMVERLHGALVEAPGWRVGQMYEESPILRRALEIALTEPPARPEGAEDIEALVEKSLSGDALSDAQVRALADFLAECGVRVTGGN